MASEFAPSMGAKPPSSPTPVGRPLLLSTDLSAWYVSAPMRSPSLKDGAPMGAIMNSWKSVLSKLACAPPFMMFIIGTGRVNAPTPPR